jgi:hypothetical protein
MKAAGTVPHRERGDSQAIKLEQVFYARFLSREHPLELHKVQRLLLSYSTSPLTWGMLVTHLRTKGNYPFRNNYNYKALLENEKADSLQRRFKSSRLGERFIRKGC